MTYWIRAVDPLQLSALGLLCLSWAVGGWLIITHAFAARARERLLTGIAAGFVLFLTLSNLLARVLPLPAAFSVAAGLILLAGVLLGWSARGRRAFVNPGDLRAWPQLLFLGGITAVFTLILRGLAIFDDYLHLPLVSIMGAGDIPPHFYLNPAVIFNYHYALQVFAACLERLGGFYPWSSWDVSRAFAFAFTLVLGWLWLRRLTGSSLGAVLGSLLLGFGGGARWLLLFLPTSWLTRMAAGLQLQASAIAAGGSLTTDLISPFATQGAGPFPYPFAYTNAIYDPLNFVLGGTGALPALTVVLLLLMARPRFSPVAVAAYSLILANLALSGENVYAVLLGGVIVAAALTLLARRRGQLAGLRREVWSWAAVLGISLVISLVQGAFLTDVTSALLGRLAGSAAAASANVYGFSLRWPPALLSGHLGPLSLLAPGQLAILLAEIGPVLVLGPGVTYYAVRRRRSTHWLWLGLSYGALRELRCAHLRPLRRRSFDYAPACHGGVALVAARLRPPLALAPTRSGLVALGGRVWLRDRRLRRFRAVRSAADGDTNADAELLHPAAGRAVRARLLEPTGTQRPDLGFGAGTGGDHLRASLAGK